MNTGCGSSVRALGAWSVGGSRDADRMDRRMWDGLVGSMRETWVATMAMGAVPPPMLMVVDGSWLVGYVQLRAVSHGNDAATAIAEMSALAAAARTTDVAVFYEMQDVAIACDHVPLQSGAAMVAVEASPDKRVIYRFPYAEKRLPGRAPGGMIPASLEWLSAPAPDLGGELEPAIECLLQWCWKPCSFRAWMIRAGGSSQRMPGCGTRATGLDSRCARVSRVGLPRAGSPHPARQANTQINMSSHPEDAQIRRLRGRPS